MWDSGTRRLITAAIVVALVGITASAAGARVSAQTQQYEDPIGDAPSQVADISTVYATGQDNSDLIFKVNLPNRPNGLTGGDVVYVLLDTDQNPATGSQG